MLSSPVQSSHILRGASRAKQARIDVAACGISRVVKDVVAARAARGPADPTNGPRPLPARGAGVFEVILSGGVPRAVARRWRLGRVLIVRVERGGGGAALHDGLSFQVGP